MNRFISARKFAKNIIQKKKLHPPIDVKAIFDEMNIEIEEEENQYGIEAFSYLNNSIKVVINTEITFLPRRRFTLAHELGHICIPWHNGDTKCIAGDNYTLVSGKRMLDTQELEANLFASELLMPTDWVKECIELYINQGFISLVEHMKNEAKTSTMACFFALENAFASGNVFFVRKDFQEYWRIFNSVNTCTISWQYSPEQNMEFLNIICDSKEECVISQYSIIYYQVLSCPTNAQIKDIYISLNGNFFELLKKISNNCPIKTLPFMDDVLRALPEKYVIFIIMDNKIVKCLCDGDSPLKMFYRRLDSKQIFDIARSYGFVCNDIKLNKNYRILYIKEKFFSIPQSIYADPNPLLKSIVNDLYWDEDIQHKLKSINGIVASINGNNKGATREEIYNLVKYRFLIDEGLIDFCEHDHFEKYIVNKIDKMIMMRK